MRHEPMAIRTSVRALLVTSELINGVRAAARGRGPHVAPPVGRCEVGCAGAVFRSKARHPLIGTGR